MKRALNVALAGAAAAMVSSCGNLATSLNSQNFDPTTNPLDSPGSDTTSPSTVEVGPKYEPGSFVVVTDGNAGLYRRTPRGAEQPDQRLMLGTPLKVVGSSGSYLKVETEGGDIGFVPAIMVGDRAPTPAARSTGSPSMGSAPESIEPIESINPNDLTPLPPAPGPDFLAPAPEPEVPPISVEEALPPRVAPGTAPPDPLPAPTPAPTPIVPPDPVEEDEEPDELNGGE